MADLDWLMAPETARMTEADFAEFWAALGTAVRIRSRYTQPSQAAVQRDPASTIAAKVDRAPDRRTPASPAGFHATGLARDIAATPESETGS